MNRWARDELGVEMALRDHSGLGGDSRVAAREMVLAMVDRWADPSPDYSAHRADR